MTAKFDARDLTAALHQLQQVDEASSSAASPNTPLSDKEWQRREELKVKMIAARVKLKLMRDRTDALKESLERYRARAAMHA
ncbi:MAG: hypothetical protein ABIQ70_14205 [Dokdonella sp.]